MKGSARNARGEPGRDVVGCCTTEPKDQHPRTESSRMHPTCIAFWQSQLIQGTACDRRSVAKVHLGPAATRPRSGGDGEVWDIVLWVGDGAGEVACPGSEGSEVYPLRVLRENPCKVRSGRVPRAPCEASPRTFRRSAPKSVGRRTPSWCTRRRTRKRAPTLSGGYIREGSKSRSKVWNRKILMGIAGGFEQRP